MLPRSRSFVSRRSLVHNIGATGLMSALGTVGLRNYGRGELALAQDATPSDDMTALPPILAAYEAAWNAGDDGSQLAALFTDDGTFEDVPFSTLYRGHEQIAAYAAVNFAASTDLAIPTIAGFATDTWAVNEWMYSGLYTGQFPGLPPGTGQPYSFRGAHVLELRDGMISRVSAYYDLYTILVQTGAVPPPGGTPTA